MCGIAGIVCHGESEEWLRERLDPILQAIAHRGPDDSGAFLRPGLAIGARRLSIIDIEGGHQPIIGPRGQTPGERSRALPPLIARTRLIALTYAFADATTISVELPRPA